MFTTCAKHLCLNCILHLEHCLERGSFGFRMVATSFAILSDICLGVGARQAGYCSSQSSAGSGSGQQEAAFQGWWQKGPGTCAHGHGEVPSHGPPAGDVSHRIPCWHLADAHANVA